MSQQYRKVIEYLISGVKESTHREMTVAAYERFIADDEEALSVSGEVWVDQFYEYGDATQPGGAGVGWTEYLPGYPFNGNAFLDISDFAGKAVVFRFQSRYDGDHYSEQGAGGQGTGLWIDDFIVYKESSGSYPDPWSSWPLRKAWRKA